LWVKIFVAAKKKLKSGDWNAGGWW